MVPQRWYRMRHSLCGVGAIIGIVLPYALITAAVWLMALAAVAICIGLIVLAIWGIVSLWGMGQP